jgi:hypothetical protein
MTQEELDALPTLREVLALYYGPNDPIRVFDVNGEEWTVGWANGVRYKQRIRSALPWRERGPVALA